MNSKKIKFSVFAFSLLVFSGFLVFIVSAATNISSDAYEHWDWNDVIGWVDFYFDNVYVKSQKIEGYASSSVGYIAFDCATSPNGNICGTSNFKVTNDGSGNLSGFAWNDAIGWISFDCHDLDPSCTNFNYQVKINPTGRFSGWAWNDVIGWVSFNCSDLGICDVSDYKVKTSWSATAATGTLLSSIIDTGVVGGAAFNSIMWKGSQPVGTFVKFQFASATSTSNFPEPIGPGGTSFFPEPIGPGGTSLVTDAYNTTGPNMPVELKRVYHNNHRYYRYKIILESDVSQTVSPRVDDVIVNWSP